MVSDRVAPPGKRKGEGGMVSDQIDYGVQSDTILTIDLDAILKMSSRDVSIKSHSVLA